MKVYRFGIVFDSKSELGAVLGMSPYGGTPLPAPNSKLTRSDYLSEQDIINRLIKLAGCEDDNAAVALFHKMVQEHRANCERLKQA